MTDNTVNDAHIEALQANAEKHAEEIFEHISGAHYDNERDQLTFQGGVIAHLAFLQTKADPINAELFRDFITELMTAALSDVIAAKFAEIRQAASA